MAHEASHRCLGIVRPRRSTPAFRVRTCEDGALRLHGELDLATASGLAETMSRTVLSGGSPLTLDLSDLALCSCAGLSALLVEHLRRLATGSGLILATPSAGVRRILSVTGLDATFDIRPRAADARPNPTDPDTTASSANERPRDRDELPADWAFRSIAQLTRTGPPASARSTNLRRRRPSMGFPPWLPEGVAVGPDGPHPRLRNRPVGASHRGPAPCRPGPGRPLR